MDLTVVNAALAASEALVRALSGGGISPGIERTL